MIKKKGGKLGLMLDSRAAKLFYLAVVGLPLVQFCIFYIGVNFNSILLAFRNYDALTGVYSFAGLSHFKEFITGLFQNSVLVFAVKNSLIAYIVGLVVGLPLTLLFSWYIYRKCFLYKTMRFFLFLPSILPMIVLIIVFSNFNGVVFPEIGLPDYLSNPETQFGALLFFNTWIGFGGGILFYSGAMSQIDPSLLEAASIDGATSFRQFYSIVLPGIYGTMSTFLITGVGALFMNQLNLYGFFADIARAETYTLGYYLFTQVIGNNASMAQYPYASAAGLCLTLVAAPLTFLVKWALEKCGPKEE